MKKSRRLTEKDLPALTKKLLGKGGSPVAAVARKRSKYGNEPVVVDGVRFDSIGESERYAQLQLLERAGKVRDIRRQVAFGLTVNGELIGTYVADFLFFEALGGTWRRVVEDWKSPASKTPLYEWKKKHLRAEHGIAILETGCWGER